MDAWIIVVIVVAVLILAVAIALVARRGRGGNDLKDRFGPEYDRTVARADSTDEAERELAGRVERHDELDIESLSDEQRHSYVEEWRDVQRRFVDEPAGTLGDADDLITRAMRDRGYPTDDVDQKTRDLSVEHAGTIGSYREAHAIADEHERSGVSTDLLRQAMQHYRDVFEAVVESDTSRGSERA